MGGCTSRPKAKIPQYDNPGQRIVDGSNAVLVVGYSERFLSGVVSQMSHLVAYITPRPQVIPRKLSSKTDITPELSQGVRMVMLVATSSQRMLILSDKEESQFGKLYHTLRDFRVDIFLVLVGHSDSSYLDPRQLFSHRLQGLFDNQKIISQLAQDNKFISLGFMYEPEEIEFNKTQVAVVTTWITNNVSHKNDYVNVGDTGGFDDRTQLNQQQQQQQHHQQQQAPSSPAYTAEVPQSSDRVVLIAGHNGRYVEGVAQALYYLLVTANIEDIQLRLKLLKGNTKSISEEISQGVRLFVLVATASQRMLLISNREESQIGRVYHEAVQCGGRIFLLLVGHMPSEELPTTYPYSPDLQTMFRGQPQIGQLAEQNRFISLGFQHNIQDLSFNATQSRLLYAWVTEERVRGQDRMDVNNNRPIMRKEPSKNQLNSPEGRLVIVCNDPDYLQPMTEALYHVMETHGIHPAPIINQWLCSHVDDISGVVDKTTMVMLIGTAKIRLPLISSQKKQKDQLGQVYWETKRQQAPTFLVLAGFEHQERLYSEQLETFIQSQPEVNSLKFKERFISIGQDTSQPLFNRFQSLVISNWIKQNQTPRNIALPQTPRSSVIPSEYQQVSPELDIHKAQPVQRGQDQRHDSQDQSEYSEPRRFNFPQIQQNKQEPSLSEYSEQSVQNYPLHRGGKSQDLSHEPAYGGAPTQRPQQAYVRNSPQSSPGIYADERQHTKRIHAPVVNELQQAMYSKAQGMQHRRVPEDTRSRREAEEQSLYSKANNVPRVQENFKHGAKNYQQPRGHVQQNYEYSKNSPQPQTYRDNRHNMQPQRQYKDHVMIPNGMEHINPEELTGAFYNKPQHPRSPHLTQEVPQRQYHPRGQQGYGDYSYHNGRMVTHNPNYRTQDGPEALCTAV